MDKRMAALQVFTRDEMICIGQVTQVSDDVVEISPEQVTLLIQWLQQAVVELTSDE